MSDFSGSSDDDFSDDFSEDNKNKDSGDDFEFGESYAESDKESPKKKGSNSNSGGGNGKGGKTTKVQNLPFDEAVEIASDEESDLGTSIDSIAEQNQMKNGDTPPKTNTSNTRQEYDDDDSDASSDASENDKKETYTKKEVPAKLTHLNANDRPTKATGGSRGSQGKSPNDSLNKNNKGKDTFDSDESSVSSDGTGEEEDDEDDSPSKVKRVEGEYNPDDYAHLNVSAEVKDLWNYIGRYKPHNIELETKLKCFIPDYIPAVGEIDAFLKCPPPGQKTEELGLKVLDEPASHQSDPTVLDLQLRAISKKSNLEPMIVRSLENADKNPREIDKWIKSISDLHRSKPPPQVHYTKSMPDIERLMQVWPDEFESSLQKGMKLPPPEIDLSIRDYARVLCAILDIPVPQSAIESLHVLFTLYSEFAGNQHFMAIANKGNEVGDVGLGNEIKQDNTIMMTNNTSGSTNTMSFHK